ncbi:MAG: GspH/FimT family pseudopilin [Gammaproteobacteria bacterium]|nr:GspH/FimT family pseudopilin [Gammaproteobacteria bacterium]
MTKNNHGFTLIELIVTLAVVSIVLVTGIPALTQMTDNNRLVTQINSIAGSLALARSEAIKSATTVTLCVSTNGTSCDGTDATNWENGWLVFTDSNRDNAINGSTDTLIKIQNKFNGGTTLRLSIYDVTGVYQFLADGTSRDRNLSGSSVGTFTLCESTKTATKAKAVNVNFIGRPSRAEGINPTAKPVLNAANPAVAVSCPL